MTMEKKDLHKVIHAQAQLIDFLSRDKAKKEREIHNLKQVLGVKVKEVRRDFRRLEPKLAQNRRLIYQLLIDKTRDYPQGLTYNQIRTMFRNRYGYEPTVGNRVRELRKQGLVYTYMSKKRLHVVPNLHKDVMQEDVKIIKHGVED